MTDSPRTTTLCALPVTTCVEHRQTDRDRVTWRGHDAGTNGLALLLHRLGPFNQCRDGALASHCDAFRLVMTVAVEARARRVASARRR
jgi:hypothetical protein